MNAAYDAKAPQKVPVAIAHDGAVYEVVFHFDPFTDAEVAAYFNGEESGERSPAEVFFDALVRKAEGIEYEERAELLTLTPQADKEFCVREALLGAVRRPLPKAQKKLNWAQVKPQQTYHLICFFNGSEIETSITLDTPSAEHLRVFRALQSRSFPVRFGDHQITSLTQGLHLLYEAEYKGDANYDGLVPLHHQLLVMQLHLGGYRELILGK